MKKNISLVLIFVLLISMTSMWTSAFAQNQSSKLPDCLKASNERYSDSIGEAIENSKFSQDRIDKDNIYIIEKKNTVVFEGGPDYNQFYVALPCNDTDDIRFASFYKGAYQSEGMNTLSWLNHVETHQNTKIEEYIKTNGLKNITEAVNIMLCVSGGTNVTRAKINAYKVSAAGDTYYIPYFVDGVFNPGNDENCRIELCKAYTEEEFAKLTKAETQSFLNYREAEKKAEEERQAAKEKAEAEKYRPVVSLDNEGDEIIKVNGTNLDDILNELTESIELMGFASTIKMGIKTSDEDYSVIYRWQKEGDVAGVCEFAEGLFDELKTQVATGKPNSPKNTSYCNFALKHDEGYKSVKHQLEISVWDNGVKITVNRDKTIEFKVRNSDAIISYLDKYADDSFEGFTYEKDDKNMPETEDAVEIPKKEDIKEIPEADDTESETKSEESKTKAPQETENESAKEPGEKEPEVKKSEEKDARECADILYKSGLIKGTDKGYELEKTLTREESAVILVRLLGKEGKIRPDDFDEVFTDVGKDRWSYAYVMYCYEYNITKGTSTSTYSPDAEIDAEQFVTLLMRLMGHDEAEPDTALTKSVGYKLLPSDMAEELKESKVFTRSQMVRIVYNIFSKKLLTND